MPIELTADQVALLAALVEHGNNLNASHRRGRFIFVNRCRFLYRDLMYLRAARLVVSDAQDGYLHFAVTEAGHRYLAAIAKVYDEEGGM